MASPQKENGYTSISNELMGALARIRINGEARQVLDFILLKTYGWNKKEDAISLSQFVNGTGLKKTTICKAINKLQSMNIVTQKDNDVANIYGILKNYEYWKPLPKKITIVKSLPKKIMVVTQKDNASLPKKGPTITTTTKATTTKAIDIPESSSGQLPDLLKDNQKHIQIIGLLARAKKINFADREQQSSFIRRNLRAAQNLKPYQPVRVAEVMKYLIDNADFKWTLETVGKYIDDDLTKLKGIGQTEDDLIKSILNK